MLQIFLSGAAVMLLPHGFLRAGLVGGTLMLAVTAGLTARNMNLLVALRQDIHRELGVSQYAGVENSGNSRLVVSLAAMAEIGLGRWGKLAVTLCVLVSKCGYCALYLVLIGRIARSVVLNSTGCTVAFDPWVGAAASLVVILPMTFIRRIRVLAIPSYFADAFMMTMLVAVGTFAAHRLSTSGPALGATENLFRWRSAPLFLGPALFSFEGVALALPISDSMARPEALATITGFMLCAVSVTFIAFSSVCYLAFGEATHTVVLHNLEGGSTAVILVALACYGLALLLTFPLQFIPVSRMADKYFFPPPPTSLQLQHLAGTSAALRTTLLKNTLRVSIVAVIMAVAIFGDRQIENFIALVGALACCPLAIVFPPLMRLRMMSWARMSPAEKYGDIICIAMGVSASLLSLAATIYAWADTQPNIGCLLKGKES